VRPTTRKGRDFAVLAVDDHYRLECGQTGRRTSSSRPAISAVVTRRVDVGQVEGVLEHASQ